MDVMTEDLANALDAAKVSSYDATKILSAAAGAFGQSLKQTNINRSTIYRKREAVRTSTADKVRKSFDPSNVLTLHWDGKIVKGLTGITTVDRLAILVTGLDASQLLAIPPLYRSTGTKIAEAVVGEVNKCNLEDRIKALNYDTTSVNSGGCRQRKHELLIRTSCLNTLYSHELGLIACDRTKKRSCRGNNRFSGKKLTRTSLPSSHL